VAAAVLGVLLGVLSQSARLLRLQVLDAERRAEEIATARNLLEELQHKPWNEIDAESARSLGVSPAVRRRWPRARVEVAVDDFARPVVGKRITVSVSLEPGDRRTPCRLVTWAYAAAQEALP
jgi:hypothetical protein